jgi:hypothetical protein
MEQVAYSIELFLSVCGIPRLYCMLLSSDHTEHDFALYASLET